MTERQEDPLPSSCAHCGGLAEKSCSRCKGAPTEDGEQHLTIRYCGKSCQAAHWKTHKEACKKLNMRRKIFRTAETALQALLDLRECSFPCNITRVETEENSTRIHVEPGLPFQVHTKFARHLFPEPNDCAAMLTKGICSDSTVYTYQLIIAALRGHIASFKVNAYKPLNRRRSIQLYINGERCSLQDPLHEIDVVGLESGEQFVLDFAGAQHGYYRPIVPHQEYFSSRDDNHYWRLVPGGREVQFVERMPSFWDTEIDSLPSRILRCHYALAMDAALVEWEKTPGQQLDKIMDAPQEQYLAKKESFLSFRRSSLLRHREELVATGLIRHTGTGRTFMTSKYLALKDEIPVSLGGIVYRPRGRSKRYLSKNEVLASMNVIMYTPDPRSDKYLSTEFPKLKTAISVPMHLVHGLEEAFSVDRSERECWQVAKDLGIEQLLARLAEEN